MTDDELRQVEQKARIRCQANEEKAKRDGGIYDPILKRWMKWTADGPDPADLVAYQAEQVEETRRWYLQLLTEVASTIRQRAFATGTWAFFCESPIEFQFFVEAFEQGWWLRPQLTVDQYRLDLADEEQKVAIELDGHDYHKTKQQRGHDAKRDRRLTELGWKVLRFTGSEVHADVGQCVREARKAAGIPDAKQPT